MSIIRISTDAFTRVSEIEKELGVYKRRELLLRKQTLSEDGLDLSIKDYIVKPTPRIELIAPRNDKLFDSDVDLTQDDYLVKSLPISLSKEFLFKDILFYIIDPKIENNKILSGIVCQLLLSREEKITSRVFVLRQEKDYLNRFPIDYRP